MKKKRADHEIKHGEFLAAGDTESLWGWELQLGSCERSDAQSLSPKRLN